ncbi:hypothetical protein BD413DRAFT_431793, partial [Trametes elegans]
LIFQWNLWESGSEATGLRGGYPDPTVLSVLCSVCGHWRNIALDTPMLWRNIQVRRRTPWLRHCMRQSRSVTLNILFLATTPFVSAASSLWDERYRIRELIISDATRGTVELIEMLLHNSMPALEVLEIDPLFDEHPILALGDDPRALPALKNLRLDDIRLDWQRSGLAMRNLRNLELMGDFWGNKQPSFRLFMRCLQGCPELEYLYFYSVLPVIYCGRQLAEDGPVPVVSLPNLESITFKRCLDFQAHDVYHILDNLMLPDSASIEVHARRTQVGPAASPPHRYIDYVPRGATFALRLQNVEKVDIYAPSRLVFETESGGETKIDLEDGASARIDYANEQRMQDMCTLLAGASVSNFANRALHVSQDTWARVFRLFPGIQDLTLTASPYVGEYVPGQITAALDALRRDGAGLCELNVVEIEHGEWSPELFDALIEALQARANRGFMPLSELHMEIIGRDVDDPEKVAMHEAYMDRLGELVEPSSGVHYED